MDEKSDRYAREDAYAAKVLARDRARNEKRKNGLPPFLMVRSGLLNGWSITLLTLVFAVGMATYSVKTQINWPNIVAIAVLFCGICYGAIGTKRKHGLLKRDIETIKREFSNYIGRKDYPLNLSGEIYSPKLAKILMAHIVKHEPGVFDKMIDNPGTVTDPETRSNIIDGYLRQCPGAANKIIDTFKPGDVDPTVYNTALKYVERLKNSGKQYM